MTPRVDDIQGGIQMPNCQNCGAIVSKQYVRVFTPPESPDPRVCPWCPDKIRDGAAVRDARSLREGDSYE